MTTTQHTVETATALLASRVGSPPFSEADQKNIARILGLLENATEEQAAALEAHLDAYRTASQIRAYERVAVKLTSWAATAAIMGQAELAAEYEDKAEVSLEMAEALRFLA